MQQKQGQIEIINFSQYKIKYHEMGMSFVQWRLTIEMTWTVPFIFNIHQGLFSLF